VVVIPKGDSHTFCNASETYGLVIELVLEPNRRERDEEFFSKMSYLPALSLQLLTHPSGENADLSR
jgi:hypothetical protein